MAVLAVVVLYALASAAVVRADTCSEICVCKWKNGKQSVECREKSLITLPSGLDGGTQVLDMSGNNVQILSADAFHRVGLLNLQRVYMSQCRIGQIDGHALRGLTNVVELDLSRNMLTAVPSATLADVPLLRDLSLAHNPIQKIEPHAFRRCAGLVRLDVSGCELHAVAAAAFVGIDRLETLKLDDNLLTGLLPGTVESLHRVHGVELHGNPWHCDCTMRPVKLWLTRNNIPTEVDPRCATGPAHAANRTFAALTADDFACRPDIERDTATVEAAIGDNASVSCRIHSSPAAKVSWYWNGRPLANNTAFGPFQRVFMTDGAGHSTLLLTNVQPADSGQFLCVAENRAGRAEANFTLVVTRLGGLAFLANGQVAGLSVFLVLLIVTILLVIVYLLVRIKRLPPSSGRPDGKPAHRPVTTAASATSNGTAVIVQVKRPVTVPATAAYAGPAATTVSTASTVAATYRDPASTAATAAVHSQPAAAMAAADGTATVRRPKLTGLAFATDNYETGHGYGSVLDASRTAALYRSQPSNPDLIADAPDQTVGGNHERQPPLAARRSASGEYRRTADDSLYSPGFWTQSDAATANDPLTPVVEKSSSSSLSPPSTNTAVTGGQADPAVAKAASIRVWKHGVQVMPPLSALKRALNKGSPDEGYQEGCGTDV